MPKATDKRVFDITAQTQDGSERRVLAISADSSVLDLYLALLGAFNWRGDYDLAEREYYRVSIGSRVFESGKGSRTPLRRVLDAGTAFSTTTRDLVISAEVTSSYVVQSRRHFPKVLDGAGANFDAQRDTWHAQSAMRREFRGFGGEPALLSAAASREHRQARLHGFFSAIVSGPMIMPGEWLARVTDMSVMNEYDAVAQQLHEKRDDFVAAVEGFASIGEGEGSIEWARGYFDGVALRANEWEVFAREEPARKLMMPLGLLCFECGRDLNKREWLRDNEFRANVSRASALAAIGLWEEWRRRLFEPAAPVRRSQPKISPNTPCPCGSGKKYKRCCGSPLRLVKG